LRQISIHARAGQGAITIASLLGTAAFLEGKQALAFPHFGAARMGAPMDSFVRISEQEIRIRSQIYEPNYILVVDDTLLRGYNFFQNMIPGGASFINLSEQGYLPEAEGISVYCIPADDIAENLFGKRMGNTALLGAFSAGTGEVSLDSLQKAIDKKFDGKIADVNKKAIEEGYNYFKKKYT